MNPHSFSISCVLNPNLRSCVGLYLIIAALVGALPQPNLLAWQVPLIVRDNSYEDASLAEIDPRGKLRFRVGNAEVATTLPEVVRLGFQTTPRKGIAVLLTDHSILIARAIRIVGKNLEVESNLWETVSIPVGRVRGLLLSTPANPKVWYEQIDRIFQEKGREDHITLKNGQVFAGVLAQNAKEPIDSTNDLLELSINVQGKSVGVSFVECESIVFSPTLTPLMEPQDGSAMICLKDGSAIQTQSIRTSENGPVTLLLNSGDRLQSVDRSQIWQTNLLGAFGSPEGVQFLSSLTPSSYRHIGQWTTQWELGIDHDLSGSPILLRGGRIARAVSMHAASQAAYRWNGLPAKFRATAMLASSEHFEQSTPGKAIARVMIARDKKLQDASPAITLSRQIQPYSFEVDLTGAQALVLLVEAGTDGQMGDQVWWLDARIESKTVEAKP